MVEQAAHNSLVVGSIPAKFKMKKFNKNHKTFNLLNYMKHTSFFLIIFKNNYNNLKPINISYVKTKVLNSQLKKSLKFSIKTTGLLATIKTSTIFIKFYVKMFLLFKQVNLILDFILAINLNNNLYIKSYFKNLSSFSYIQNKKLIYKFFISKLKKLNSK